jgi:peptidoglycan/xylan/chitin deacetylase (PgdA/CDA1 family)
MRAWLQPIRIPILYYHEIGRTPSKHVVSPEQFEAQLDWLGAAGFTALSMDDVVAVYEGERPPPVRSVVLSFDDGRAGVRDFAAPALARRGLPAILYLVTGWLDGEPMPDLERYSEFVTWSDLEALQQAGFTLGSHSVSHRNLKRIDPSEVASEVFASRRRLEEKLGRPVLHFSFPYGRRTRAVTRVVRAAGYRTAVVTGDRHNGRFARLHRLYRVRADGRHSLETFQDRLLSPPR